MYLQPGRSSGTQLRLVYETFTLLQNTCHIILLHYYTPLIPLFLSVFYLLPTGSTSATYIYRYLLMAIPSTPQGMK